MQDNWEYTIPSFSRNPHLSKVTNVIAMMLLNRIGEPDFENMEIFVNDDDSLFKGSKLLLDVFRFLKIPFKIHTIDPDGWEMKEINKNAALEKEDNSLFSFLLKPLTFKTIKVFGKIDFKILHLLLSIAEEIFNNKIDVRIYYGKFLKLDNPRIIFGGFDNPKINFTNVSRRIKPNEITELNMKNMDWEKLTKLFPIIERRSNGEVRSYEKGLSYTDWKRDVGTGYEDGDILDWLANN